MNAGTVDLILAAALAVFALKGLMTGFVRSVFSVGAIVLAWAVSALHPELTAGALTWAFGASGPALALASRIVTWIVVYAAAQALAFLLTGLLEKIGLGGLDKLAGLMIGAAAGILVGALPLALIQSVPAFARFEPVQAVVRQSIMLNLYKPIVALAVAPPARR